MQPGFIGRREENKRDVARHRSGPHGYGDWQLASATIGLLYRVCCEKRKDDEKHYTYKERDIWRLVSICVESKTLGDGCTKPLGLVRHYCHTKPKKYKISFNSETKLYSPGVLGYCASKPWES